MDNNVSYVQIGDSGGVEYDTNDKKLGVTDGRRTIEAELIVLALLLLLLPNETNDCDVCTMSECLDLKDWTRCL